MDASGYNQKKANQNYFAEFEHILTIMAKCYKSIVYDKVKIPRDENKIRDVFIGSKYLKNRVYKNTIGAIEYRFSRETVEMENDKRADIQIIHKSRFEDDEAYYILECKLLDNKAKRGTSGLNAKYITNGICRFIKSDYYSTFFKTNAMIGFVVENMDIHSNTEDINCLLKNNYSKESNTISTISKCFFIDDFRYQYSSNHKTDKGKNIRLYHLMFNLVSNIWK